MLNVKETLGQQLALLAEASKDAAYSARDMENTMRVRGQNAHNLAELSLAMERVAYALTICEETQSQERV